MSFGILTLATAGDYKKAIGLALSVRVSNPGVPIAVACSPKVRPLVAPYFDHVVDENPTLRGFEHKLHLDRYSPFEETFFFDSDVLVFRPLSEVLDSWRSQPYTACGGYVTGGSSPFGLDRVKAMRSIGAAKLVHIDGAGHAYFRKPDCGAVFDLARSVSRTYLQYGSNVRFCDEDVIDIVMTMHDLKPMRSEEFWSRYLSGRRRSVRINATQGQCELELAVSGKKQRPYMMHFAAKEVPFTYTRQLRKLFKQSGVSTRGLFDLALRDFAELNIVWPLKATVKRLFAARPNGARLLRAAMK